MKILAIDFGLKHLGLAISDGELAEPYKELEFKSQIQLISQISQICQKEKVEKIVIGMPEGKLVKVIQQFGQELEEKTHLPITFQDETLTSKEAKTKMVEAGLPRGKRQKSDHLFSACLILQEYLDYQHNDSS